MLETLCPDMNPDLGEMPRAAPTALEVASAPERTKPINQMLTVGCWPQGHKEELILYFSSFLGADALQKKKNAHIILSIVKGDWVA